MGRVFWLSHTGGSVCEIYACCRLRKEYPHCGHCPELPCPRFAMDNPTKSAAENAIDLAYQLEVLGTMRDYDLRTKAKAPREMKTAAPTGSCFFVLFFLFWLSPQF